MDNKYLAVFLVTMVAAAEVTTVATDVRDRPVSSNKPMYFITKALTALPYELLIVIFGSKLKKHGNVLYGNIDTYVDNAIEALVPFIEEHGLDPMTLPDVEESFEVNPFVVKYSARIRIYDGHMDGLVNVSRYGKQLIFFYGKMVRVRMHLQFTDLKIVYKYIVDLMDIFTLSGNFLATLDRFVANIDVIIDFNKDEVILRRFSLTDLGNLGINMTGNDLTDWVVNPVGGIFLSIFNNVILKVVEANIQNAVQDIVSHLNANVKDIIHSLGSFS